MICQTCWKSYPKLWMRFSRNHVFCHCGRGFSKTTDPIWFKLFECIPRSIISSRRRGFFVSNCRRKNDWKLKKMQQKKTKKGCLLLIFHDFLFQMIRATAAVQKKTKICSLTMSTILILFKKISYKTCKNYFSQQKKKKETEICW